MRHILIPIKLLRPHQGRKAGTVIKRRKAHADKLVSLNIAKYVQEEKEEKVIYETKEEKFEPETKDYSETPIRELAEIAGTLSDDDLLEIVKSDYRKGAVKLAQEELQRR